MQAIGPFICHVTVRYDANLGRLRIWGLGVRLLSGAPQFQRFMNGHGESVFLRASCTITEFFEGHLADRSRHTVIRTVEGYDTAQTGVALAPFILRTDGRGLGRQGRIAESYGAPIEYLVSECPDGLNPRSRCRDPHRSGSETAQTIPGA